jgi:hypothetical protein
MLTSLQESGRIVRQGDSIYLRGMYQAERGAGPAVRHILEAYYGVEQSPEDPHPTDTPPIDPADRATTESVEPTGSRVRTLDLMAIDTRDGSATLTLDRRVESYNNDLETRLVLQSAQQRVIVSVGTLTLDYEFSDTAPAAEQGGQD